MNTMTDPIKRLREMLDKATPGKWSTAHRQRHDGTYSREVFDKAGKTIANMAWYPIREANAIITNQVDNAELVVDAINALPALLDCAEQLRSILHTLEARKLPLGAVIYAPDKLADCSIDQAFDAIARLGEA